MDRPTPWALGAWHPDLGEPIAGVLCRESLSSRGLEAVSDAEALSVRFEADVKALNDALKVVDAKVSALEKGADKSGRNVKRGWRVWRRSPT